MLAIWALIFQLGKLFHGSAFADTPASWSLWWAVHLALAWQLLWPQPLTWFFGITVSWLEIVIRGYKVVFFLVRPAWEFWPAIWFAHQGCVLLLFLFLAWHLYYSPAGRNLRDRQ